jgi:uncharacterized membrane protein YcaP (DUF421 family)
MEEPVFFKSWTDVGRVALLSACAYGGFILSLRISGKRTLAKMNVFDFVFVVALGSTLADTILTPESNLARGMAACVTLILIQYIISLITTRSHRLEKIINGAPVLLMSRGKFLKDVMHRERVTEDEIRASVRAQGLASLEGADAVVLETDGTFSVLHYHPETGSSLADVLEKEHRE